MSTITVTEPRPDIMAVIDHVKALAAAQPEFVYQKPTGQYSCLNVWKGEGHCIVGRALLAAGVPLEWLESNDHDSEGIMSLSTYFGWDDAGDALEWLGCVQDNQDSGDSWTQAVAKADGYVLEDRHEPMPDVDLYSYDTTDPF